MFSTKILAHKFFNIASGIEQDARKQGQPDPGTPAPKAEGMSNAQVMDTDSEDGWWAREHSARALGDSHLLHLRGKKQTLNKIATWGFRDP